MKGKMTTREKGKRKRVTTSQKAAEVRSGPVEARSPALHLGFLRGW